MATGTGPLYYVAAFLALTAEALWSRLYLRIERLDEAMVLYATFAIVYLAVPVVARRARRPLEPALGSGVVLLASLAMLMFLSGGSIAPQALWGFALLLAILERRALRRKRRGAHAGSGLRRQRAVVDPDGVVVVPRGRRRRHPAVVARARRASRC